MKKILNVSHEENLFFRLLFPHCIRAYKVSYRFPGENPPQSGASKQFLKLTDYGDHMSIDVMMI